MRLIALVVLAFLTLLPIPGRAADAPAKPSMADFTKFCETAPCRRNVEFTLKKRDGSDFAYRTPLAPPVVQPGYITVYPGETLYFEAEEGSGGALELRLVSAITHPEKTFVMSLAQKSAVGDGTGMTFEITNPFKRRVRYHLELMPLEKEIVIKSSTCPIFEGLTNYEFWPYPIFQVLIEKVRFMDLAEPASCIE
jgi:hypothetical protein